MAILQSRFELDFLCGLDGRLVESMSQPLDDALNPYLPSRCKYNLNKDFTFDFETTSFFGVNRTRLESDFGGNRLGDRLGLCLLLR